MNNYNQELLLILLKIKSILGKKEMMFKVFLVNSLLTRNKIEQNFSYEYEKDFRYLVYSKQVETDLKSLFTQGFIKITQKVTSEGVFHNFEITDKGVNKIKHTEAPFELIQEMVQNIDKINKPEAIEKKSNYLKIPYYNKVSLIK